MKNQMLSLGKTLSKLEQQMVFGGASITHIDPYCENAHDGNSYLGCQCGDGASCMTNVWVGRGWVPRGGTCQGGSCAA